MKRLIYITFLFLFCAETSAQNGFYQSYNFNNYNDGGFKVIEDSMKLIVFGRTTSGIRGGKILIVDSMGTAIAHKNHSYLTNHSFNTGLKWKNNYVGFGAQYNAVEGAANSHFLIMGRNGDSSRLQIINFAFNDRIHDAVVKNDSTFIVFGYYTDTLATDQITYFAEIDTLGNINWFKPHNNPTGLPEFITNMVASNDGGYVFAGEEYETSQGWLDKFLYKVDSQGNFVWKKTYHEPLTQRAGKVSNCSDGGFLFAGTGYDNPSNLTAERSLIKTDSAGNLIWDRKFGTNIYQEGFDVARETANGNIICAGTAHRMYNGQEVIDINLSLLDSAGILIWSKDYTYHGLQYDDYVNDLIVTSDGGFAVTGFILNAPNNQGNDVFVLKTDANGIITGLHSGFKEVTLADRIYPNPTKDLVNIPAIPNLQSIEVYDLSGKLMSAELFSRDFGINSASSNSLSLQEKSSEVFNGSNHQHDLSNYLPGIYFIKLILTDGSFQTVKVVKE